MIAAANILCRHPALQAATARRCIRTAAAGMATPAVQQELAAAISVGAPLYNQGNAAGCYQVYRGAASRLAASLPPDAPPTLVLRRALEQAAGEGSPSDAAWVMRRAFDTILDGSAEVAARAAALPPDAAVLPLVDFTSGLEGPAWGAMDDVIMGGVSSSSLRWSREDAAAAFSGNVTTDSGGGFASVRCRPWGGWAQLGAARALRLVVRGDGKIYKVQLKMGDGYDGIGYQHDFATTSSSSSSGSGSGGTSGGWQTVDLPLSDFKPNFRGRLVPNAPPLQGDQIRQMGLMISKFSDAGGTTAGFQSGSFKLLVKQIDAVLR